MKYDLQHEILARKLGRMVACAILFIGALTVAVGLTACDYDDDPYDTRDDWYLSGVWANEMYPDENMVFYDDGTGYWESMTTYDYLDFDYYCNGGNIYFTFYPVGNPSYTLNAFIDMRNGTHMAITWPPSSMFGATTIYYYRVD